MTKRKISLLITFLIVIASLFTACEAMGLETNWPVAPGGLELKDDSTLLEFVDYCYRWGILFGGLAAFVALIVGGFKYLTSVGDPNKMRDAREWITSALIGLAIIIFSFVILNTLNPDLTTLTVPTTNVGNLEVGNWSPPDLNKPCEAVITYSEPDYKGDVVIFYNPDFPAPPAPPPPSQLWPMEEIGSTGIGGCLNNSSGWWIFSSQILEIKSVKIKGACQLNLYEESNCEGKNFYAVSDSTNKLEWLNLDHIYSIKAVDISVPTPPEVENIGWSNLQPTPSTDPQTYQIDLTGKVTDLGNDDKVTVRFDYGDTKYLGMSYPERTENQIEIFNEGENFTYTIKGLASSTTYFWRAVANNKGGTTWAPTSTFTTP